MDAHTKSVVAGLLMLKFDNPAKRWEFDRLSEMEKIIIGNQVQLDILKKFTEKEFKV